MLPTVFVRRLKVSDLPRLEAIELAHAQSSPARPQWMATFRKLIEQVLEEEPEGLFILERDSVVVGWAAVRQRGIHPMTGLKDGHIFHISVAREFRGHGLGPRLLRECEAYLRSRGCESIHLTVPVDDPQQAEIFKSSGYRLSAWELERTFK
jgi:ribosomal protein S18 acetylase RimI-like enzyme